MRSKGPAVRDVLAELRRLGCEPVRTNGSHQVWRTPSGKTVPVVVNHVSAGASRNVLGTLRRVLRAEGLEFAL